MKNPKEKIKAELLKNRVIAQNCNESRQLLKKGIGTLFNDIIEYSFLETAYLHENEHLIIFNKNAKNISKQELIKLFYKLEKGFREKYAVYKDLFEKGYIVKSGLKFGAPFRVYEQSKFSKANQDRNNSHSKWLVFPLDIKKKLDIHDFFGKNRLAHSTKKKVLFAFVDEEGNVSYYQTEWVKV
jgi:tRNA-intron endonuclease